MENWSAAWSLTILTLDLITVYLESNHAKFQLNTLRNG